MSGGPVRRNPGGGGLRARLRAGGLVRPVGGGIIAGVCAGLAQGLGVSPTVVRLAFVVSLLLPGPQFLVYIGLWIVMPKDR